MQDNQWSAELVWWKQVPKMGRPWDSKPVLSLTSTLIHQKSIPIPSLRRAFEKKKKIEELIGELIFTRCERKFESILLWSQGPEDPNVEDRQIRKLHLGEIKAFPMVIHWLSLKTRFHNYVCLISLGLCSFYSSPQSLFCKDLNLCWSHCLNLFKFLALKS